MVEMQGLTVRGRCKPGTNALIWVKELCAGT